MTEKHRLFKKMMLALLLAITMIFSVIFAIPSSSGLRENGLQNYPFSSLCVEAAELPNTTYTLVQKSLTANIQSPRTVSLPVQIDETTFPDETFRNWVLENVSSDGATLTQDDVDMAEIMVDLSNQGITDLTGIEYLTTLWTLDCSGNQLTSLSLTNHPDLYDLHCENNQLTTLDVSGAPLLENLDCSNNQLTSLDFGQNTALVSLHCGFNQLMSIDLKSNTNLEVVDSSSNKLTTIDLSENTQLQTIRVNSNPIQSAKLPQGTAGLSTTFEATVDAPDGTYDLKNLLLNVQADKLQVTSGGSLEGTVLKGVATGSSDVTLSYDTMTITLHVTGPAVPDSGEDYQPAATEQAANGDTTIGIMQTRLDPQTVAFEVPLYVTVAAVSGQTDLCVPTNYSIANTSREIDGDYYKFVVTRLSLQKVTGGTWDIVDTPTESKQLALKVGGISMPTTKDTPAGTVHIVDVKDSGSVFYDLINKKFTQVDKTNALNIPLSGQVAAGVIRSDTAAAPQFRLKYTISPVDADGNPIGQVYAGNDSVAAGFGVWNEQTQQFETP